ncbi:ethanolamine ammonia-lyase subunit EutB [Paraburkholderia caballeronis]|uniref:Ethanolamine ammonia-lyase large subunit n=1 Tax=Paraburkholderia caballeronis TaxID=416943 RepID=A0A1H7VJS5_9BURK|nr:ethanolamine ammonia-lyase subunit EutB [Paraburkholderia caballeronis]PXW16025.1 ethanolamine ammonia-lyase heavy chain [Paraburkholderia caballeronis]PXW93927.1 ethanolamine ammonia-lyase heavy chain [Paraburkholderia caballeronis]RAJ89056.1 ethanolamine ammonia-lyase heavy chain [Paraburkholderia caballeronis]SED89734.1 Ethanolamine ammonia-lyase heavy chain [Paraburkholderia caballeronis]SEM09058.1 Ethanolamine ammonia-lyase heavy chain [Paraburkholderia caballeronis]
MSYTETIGSRTYRFADLKTLLAKASPLRSGDQLAGIAAASEEERVAAKMALAQTPLRAFLNDALIPYESDEVTRLIVDGHSRDAFAEIAHLTVGDFRDWLLATSTGSDALVRIAAGLTPEMVAAVSKLMRNQDLIAVAKKRPVVTRFRNTIGLPGRLSVRLQPNHPTDDVKGIAASMLDGLMYGCGDAVIGINPATDSLAAITKLLVMIDEFRERYRVPTQSCVLTHVTNTIAAIEQGAPVDLVFQSIAGTEQANAGFGISLALLKEAREAALSLKRGTVGDNVMYFETGQGSALSANAHHGVDQQTCEVRAYAVARAFDPLLTNTVVGFIGPEYLYDGKQITRAGLEDHFCGKLLGVPMGCDICYTNHAEADQDDMDNLLTLLGVAGINFIMGIPGADDVMLNYQSTSFHDALYVRDVLGLRRAPEFEEWLESMRIADARGALLPASPNQPLLEGARQWMAAG